MKPCYLIFILTLILAGCDDTGSHPWETPQPPITVPTDPLNGDTIDLSSEPALVDVQNNQLCIQLAQITGANTPTQATIVLTMADGEVTGYKVTTEMIPRKKAKNAPECVSCYTIQQGDTKTLLSKRFNIPISSIKNKSLRVGEKLQIE